MAALVSLKITRGVGQLEAAGGMTLILREEKQTLLESVTCAAQQRLPESPRRNI